MEASQRGNVPRDGAAAQAAAVQRIDVVPYPLHVRYAFVRRDIARKSFNILAIRLDRIPGKPLLDPAEVEEGLYPGFKWRTFAHRANDTIFAKMFGRKKWDRLWRGS